MTIQLVQHDYLSDSAVTFEGTADLIFADPPYNLAVKYADDPTKDRLTDDDFRKLTSRAIVALTQRARPGATFWWMTTEEHGDWTGEMLTQIVGPRVYRIVWREAFAQYQGDRALTKDYRFIFCHRVASVGWPFNEVGHHGVVTWNPHDIREQSVRQQMGDKRANPNGRVPGCVWDIRRLQGTSNDRVDWHPAQLPPELLARIVKGWSNPNDLVVDGFAGSGSLGKVCKSLNRNFVGIDRSPTYLRKMDEELSKP